MELMHQVGLDVEPQALTPYPTENTHKQKRMTPRTRRVRRTSDTTTASPEKYALATTPNEPPDSIGAYSVCIFGRKGIGKTSLAAQWPKAWVLMLEPLRQNLRIRQNTVVPVPRKEYADPTPWKQCCGYIDAAIDDSSVQTIVIDTLDRLYEMCLDDLCWGKGLADPGAANDYGATWRDLYNRFETVLNKIRFAGKGPVVLSHARFREQDDEKENVEQWVPTCTPQAYRWVQGACDLVCYYGYRGKQRVLTLTGDENVDCSSQIEGHFDGIDAIIMPSAKQGYANLEAGFQNKLPAKYRYSFDS